jgi:hypothetical protein
MKIRTGYEHIAFHADEILIPHQVSPAAIAKPGKEKTYEIVPEVNKIIHAASRIIIAKL